MSRFGANHKLVSGTIQFEMPIIHPSGDVKKVTELGGGGASMGRRRPGDRNLGLSIYMKAIFKVMRWTRSL